MKTTINNHDQEEDLTKDQNINNKLTWPVKEFGNWQGKLEAMEDFPGVSLVLNLDRIDFSSEIFYDKATLYDRYLSKDEDQGRKYNREEIEYTLTEFLGDILEQDAFMIYGFKGEVDDDKQKWFHDLVSLIDTSKLQVKLTNDDFPTFSGSELELFYRDEKIGSKELDWVSYDKWGYDDPFGRSTGWGSQIVQTNIIRLFDNSITGNWQEK